MKPIKRYDRDLGCFMFDQSGNYIHKKKRWTPKAATVLLVFAILVIISWMTERDTHVLADIDYIQIED
jgi:hypothetical protein